MKDLSESVMPLRLPPDIPMEARQTLYKKRKRRWERIRAGDDYVSLARLSLNPTYETEIPIDLPEAGELMQKAGFSLR